MGVIAKNDHTYIHRTFCSGQVFNGHADKGAVVGVHGGFPELISIHFSQPLVALEHGAFAKFLAELF